MKLLYPFAKRFIAGHDFDSAIPVISKLIGDGYDITIDYLGELSKTEEDCQNAWQQYVDIIEYYGLLHTPIDISIKPTQLGLLLEKVDCEAHLTDLAARAYEYGITIRLDMEDSSVTQDTIDLCLRIHKNYPNIGIALQSNLYRTPQDLNYLLQKNVSIRLVKGAYKENINISYQRNDLIHDQFLKQALILISDRCRSYYYLKNDIAPVPSIGTHDEDLINEILSYLPTIKIKKTDLFFEMLYGIRRDLCSSLKKDGYCVRLYVPFGTEWLPYTMRRLREYKNLKFIISNIIKEFWNEQYRRRKSIR